MAIQCEHLNTLTNNDQYERALHAFGTGWAKVWDARSLIYRCQATRNHDVAIPFGGEMMLALSKVKAKTLIMSGRTDRTLPPYMAQEIRRGVKNNIYVKIPSGLGHIACCPGAENTAEYTFITDLMKLFLSDLAQAN